MGGFFFLHARKIILNDPIRCGVQVHVSQMADNSSSSPARLFGRLRFPSSCPDGLFILCRFCASPPTNFVREGSRVTVIVFGAIIVVAASTNSTLLVVGCREEHHRENSGRTEPDAGIDVTIRRGRNSGLMQYRR